jgi:hypothetical protein
VLLCSVFCVAILDSGAKHSFVTKQFCIQHGLKVASVSAKALLADGTTTLFIVGVIWNA